MDASGKKQLEIRQVFKDYYKEFNEVLRDYALEKGFEYVKLKNSKERITAKCKADNCPFRAHASPAPNGSIFVIKTFNG